MSTPNTVAGYPIVGYGLGYPIVRAGDGQLYYYAYTEKNGQSRGWKVGTPDPNRHHHAHHLSGRQGSHHAHHHGSHHSVHHHAGTASATHRRIAGAPVHHMDSARPPVQSQAQAPAETRVAISPGGIAVPPKAEAEPSGWAGKLEAFENRHLRLVLGIQGGLDVAAGVAGVATTLTIALALAPETGGLSLLVAAAIITYGVTRGTVQTAVGVTELVVAAGGNKEQEESTKEGMEHVKTLTSISGFLILGTQQVRHRRLTKDDWTHAGFASDAETILSGRGVDRAFEDASEAVRISSRVAAVMKWGGRADKADQVHSAGKDSLSAADWAQKLVEQQNRDRKRKSGQQPPTPATPTH